MRPAAAVCAIALGLGSFVDGQAATETGIADLLSRAGRYAQDYYSRGRTILSRETVRLQPLDRQLQPSSEWRQIVYDVRVEWDPSRPGEPVVTRDLISAGGRLNTLTRRDSECFDLKAESPEPLAMLLPDRQKQYTFTVARSQESPSIVPLDFTQNSSEPPGVSWQGNCGTIDLKGNTVGRVWIDSTTGAVMRIDERLKRPFPYVVPLTMIRGQHPIAQSVDRLETSIRYEPVRFQAPDETLMLPASIRTLAVIHNSGVPQLLTLQTYGNHRRFVTGARVVK